MRVIAGCFYRLADMTYVECQDAGNDSVKLVNLGGTTVRELPVQNDVPHLYEVGLNAFALAKEQHQHPERFDENGNRKPLELNETTGVIEVSKSKKANRAPNPVDG